MADEEVIEEAESSIALLILDMSEEQVKEVFYEIKMVKDNCRKLALSDFFQLAIDCKLWISNPQETTLSWVVPEAGTSKFVADSEEAQLIPSLKGLSNLVHVPKKHYSAFAISNLLEVLRENEITHVCVCGIHTDTSVFATVMDAFVHGFETFVVSDAVSSSRGRDAHEQGLKNLQNHFGNDVLVKINDLLTDEEEYEEEIVSEEEVEEVEEEEFIEEVVDDEYEVEEVEEDPELEQKRIEDERKKIDAARKADQEKLAKQAKTAERDRLEAEIKQKEDARKAEEAKLEKQHKKAEKKKGGGWFGGGKKAPAPAPAPAKKAAAPAPAQAKKAPAPAPAKEEPEGKVYRFPFSNKPKKTNAAPGTAGNRVPKGTGGVKKIDQPIGTGVATKMVELKKSGLTGPPKQKRLKTPKVITDTKEEWDKKGNITRTITKYITEVDGTKRTEKTVEHIPAK